ncbi:hypothetical protein KDL29_09610 [bacterium]|nr:hypothetical protein [bacterium]
MQQATSREHRLIAGTMLACLLLWLAGALYLGRARIQDKLNPVWQHDFRTDTLVVSLIEEDEAILLLWRDMQWSLARMNAEQGLLWQTDYRNGYVESVCRLDELIIVMSQAADTYALNFKTGAEVWHYRPVYWDAVTLTEDETGPDASLLVCAGALAYGLDDNGNLQWSRNLVDLIPDASLIGWCGDRSRPDALLFAGESGVHVVNANGSVSVPAGGDISLKRAFLRQKLPDGSLILDTSEGKKIFNPSGFLSDYELPPVLGISDENWTELSIAPDGRIALGLRDEVHATDEHGVARFTYKARDEHIVDQALVPDGLAVMLWRDDMLALSFNRLVALEVIRVKGGAPLMNPPIARSQRDYRLMLQSRDSIDILLNWPHLCRRDSQAGISMAVESFGEHILIHNRDGRVACYRVARQ